MTIVTEEEGDLAHHTSDAITRQVVWKTDKYGFRKANNNVKQYDVVVVGDSNIVGLGLSQEDMLTELIEKKSGMTAYPYAWATINQFTGSPRFNTNKPKVVVFGILESLVEHQPVFSEIGISGKEFVEESLVQKYHIYKDRIVKLSLINYLKAKLMRFSQKLQKTLFPRHPFQTVTGITKGEDMYFLGPEGRNAPVNKEVFDHIISILLSYKEGLAKRGIHFIFLPVSNKSNIYYKKLGPDVKQRPFLAELIKRLNELGVDTINTQEAFNRARDASSEYLYYTDDLHWNSNATNISADLIIKRIKANGW